MRDRTNISDALENHEENKNKDLSSTSCEFVSLECTPQVRYNSFRQPNYLLNRRLLPKSRTEVAGNRGQSILQCPAKLTRVQLHKRARGKDLPCSLLTAVRMCFFSYVRAAVSQALLGWSTARHFIALRGQRDFINSSILL